MGKDSRILSRESTQTSGDPQIDKDVKGAEERGESEGRWKEKTDGSLQTCTVCWVMLGHRGTNLY